MISLTQAPRGKRRLRPWACIANGREGKAGERRWEGGTRDNASIGWLCLHTAAVLHMMGAKCMPARHSIAGTFKGH